MNRRIYLLLLALLFAVPEVWGQTQAGEIQGTVTDKKTGEPIPFANIVALKDGVQKGGTTTGLEGKFTIKPLEPGSYDIQATYVGKNKYVKTGVTVSPDKITFIDVQMSEQVTETEIVEVVEYVKPVIEQDNNTTGGQLTAEEVAKAPTRSVNQLAALTGGTYSAGGGTPSIKGARTSGTIYYVDGVRVRGLNGVPQGSIQNLSVLTGGIPAEYGDATGGVISITTKGPSSKYRGNLEMISSQFIDPYGYNLAEGSVTGPIITKNKGTDSAKAVLGFLLSGNVNYQLDPSPSPIGIWKVQDDVLADIKETPLVPSPIGGGFVPAASFVTRDQMEQVQARPNFDQFGYNINGKLDFKVTDQINVTAGGQVGHRDGNNFSYASSLFNFENYPSTTFNTYRGYARMTQTFDTKKAEGEEESSGLQIKDAFYTLQVDYTKQFNRSENPDYGRDFFQYGHYGNFDLYNAPFYAFQEGQINGVEEEAHFQTGFADTLLTFAPAPYNTAAGNYTESYINFQDQPVRNINEVRANGGLLNGDVPSNVYSLWTNAGTPVGGYSEFEQDQLRLQATGSATINGHEIKLGVQYEQLTQRSYNLGARALWNIMRQSMNAHILQLDTDNPMPVYDDNGVFLDTVKYERLDDGTQTEFDKNFRNYLIEQGATDVYGNPIDEKTFVNIDRYDPSEFEMSYFSADELLQNQVVSYYGYDYTGERSNSRPSLDDFLNDEKNRPIAPYNPIYVAGFIQDKFTFKDLIFRVGVRIDRFDANQPVLKDRYSLYPIRSVSEVDPTGLLETGEHPGNIGEDYAVYVDDPTNPTQIVGYREGDVWFDETGTEVADPITLAFATTTGSISPYLEAESEEDLRLTTESFEDYQPQTNILPRIAFSFPISESANFFANYDVLTQRPSSGLLTTPDDFFYLQQRATGVIPNPSLKPEQRTNYELGFKQRLSSNMGLTITVYYGETRNLIQLVQVNQAYPISYRTYDNIDFGTVKGLTLKYDIRRTPKSNFQMTANYTLQFANGTGSNAVDAASLLNAGQPNLRTPFPLDNDIRHNFQANVDYRFGAGRSYNGPTTEKGKQILRNTGINLIFSAVSGRPYSQQQNVTQDVGIGIRQNSLLEGSVNGARMPFNFNIDLRLDRDWALDFSKKEKEGEEASSKKKRKPVYLNTYIWVQNVLNLRNVRGVYRYTGTPDDDGFLSSQEGRQVAESQIVPQAFIDQYSIKVNNPGNYSLPRLIRLGMIFNF